MLGAHCDDIEIGCGGTILKMTTKVSNLNFKWIVFSSNETRKQEAKESAEAFLQGANKKSVHIEQFRNSFFPYIGGKIKKYFENIKHDFNPDLIFTHYRHDLHQDHRLICELTWNTYRNHTILEYEVPKYDGDIGNPNCYVTLEEKNCQEKISIIMDKFKSQHSRGWFDKKTFWSLMRIRGMESNSPSNFAEAFYARKLIIGDIF